MGIARGASTEGAPRDLFDRPVDFPKCAVVTTSTQISMGDQAGATLQNYNSDLVACIEDLRGKREELNTSIATDEEEKAKIQNDLRILTERLARINDNLARKISS